MYIVQVFYINGNDEMWGTFPAFEQARAWAEGLKSRPNSQVVSYNVRALNKL